MRYLLQNTDDRSSADTELKRVWMGQYEKLKNNVDDACVQRLEGILADDEWRRLGQPIDFGLRWVIDGRDFVSTTVDTPETMEATSEVMAKASMMTLTEAVNILNGLICFPDPADAYLVLLWCAQANMYNLLPACCHIAFIGPPSSGKTRAALTVLLIVNGELVSDVSEAYVSRVLDAGMILGFDEVDAQLVTHREGMLESMLRQATNPSAKRRILEKNANGEWIPRSLNIYRPCVFDYSGDMDVALMTRTLPIRMEPNADAARIAHNLYATDDLMTLRLWLQRATSELQNLAPEKIKGIILSPDFHRRIDVLTVGLPRDKELAIILLTVAELLGWAETFEEMIMRRLRLAARNRMSDYESVTINALRDVQWQKPLDKHGPAWIWQDDVLKAVNEELAGRDLRGTTPEGLGHVLTKLGLRNNVDRVKVRSWGGSRRIFRTAKVEGLIRQASLSGATGETGAEGVSSLDGFYAPDTPVSPAPSDAISPSSVDIDAAVTNADEAPNTFITNDKTLGFDVKTTEVNAETFKSDCKTLGFDVKTTEVNAETFKSDCKTDTNADGCRQYGGDTS